MYVDRSDWTLQPYTLRVCPGFYEPTEHYATCDLCPYRSRRFGYIGYAQRAIEAHIRVKHPTEETK
jgi:hypothetical protein